jgi:hypothetical protein
MSISYIEKFNDGINVKKVISFDKSEVAKYKEFFNELKREEIIQKGEQFDSNSWKLWGHELETITLFFRIPLHLKKWELILKAYMIIQIKNKFVPSYLQDKLNFLSKAIIESWGLKDFTGLVSYFDNVPNSSKNILIAGLKDIIDFVDLDKELRLSVESLLDNKYESKKRRLPPFNEITLFHSALRRLYEEWSEHEKRKYYPLFLWWEITTVIPLRPREFCLIPLDCLTPEGTKARLPRTKEKGKNGEEIFIDEVPISNNIAKYFLEYLELTKDYPKTSYLLNFEMYIESMGIYKTNFVNNQVYKGQLWNLINHFYQEIMCDKFGYIQEPYQRKDIRRTQLAHTRHLAICNMMFQGFSPLTIMKLSGHSSIYSQNPYRSHLILYAESRVIQLTEIYRRDLRKVSFGRTKSIKNIDMGLRARRILETVDFEQTYPVDYGFCTYSPIKCPIRDCRHCKFYFIPQEMWKDALPYLMDESEKLDSQIREIVHTMMDIRNDISNNETLKNKSAELSAEIQNKAMVDARILEIQQETIDA